MRVLHFYKTYFPDTVGGIEQVINQIAQGTAAFGIQTQVLTLSSDDANTTLSIDNHVVHRAKLDFQLASTGFSFSAFRHFAALAQEVDLIHYHFPWPFMDLVHFATRPPCATVLTYHSDIVRQKYLLKLYSPLQYRFLRSIDRLVATSPNYLATSPVLQQFIEKTSVIPIGLDKDTYPQPTAAQLQYWGNILGPRFFLFVGVLRYYKGLHILLDAAQNTDYPIVIVGAGPTEMALKKQAAQLKLRNIHFLGYLPHTDKVALLTLCYAIVFPSHLRSEAFGISLLEGAMYRKPMISSEIGTGTTFINIDHETGVVIPPSDPIALRQAMQYLWDNPSIASAMGARAETRYYEHFTAARMAQSYAELYRTLVQHPTQCQGGGY